MPGAGLSVFPILAYWRFSLDGATADQISELIRLHIAELDSFRLQAVLETPLVDFHHWANGKIWTGAYGIATDDAELYLLLIQWSPRHWDRFHLVVYTSDRTGPVFEVHEVQNNHLRWAYRPAKRDGRNPERKTRFEALAKQMGFSMEDSRVAIHMPENATDLDQFLHTVFRLARSVGHVPIQTVLYRRHQRGWDRAVPAPIRFGIDYE